MAARTTHPFLAIRLFATASVLALALSSGSAEAASRLLDWDVHTWTTPGTLSDSFAIGGGSVDVLIADPNTILAGTSPDTDNALDPYSSGELSLRLEATGTTTPYVQTTLDFLYTGGVTDIQFEIFDIDRTAGSFRDIVLVQAHVLGDPSTTWVAPSLVTAIGGTPTFTINTNATRTRLRGTATAPNTGDTNGVVAIEFGGGQIYDAIRFQYRNADNSGGQQWVSLSDVSYVTVPEPGASALLALGILALSAARRASGRDAA